MPTPYTLHPTNYTIHTGSYEGGVSYERGTPVHPEPQTPRQEGPMAMMGFKDNADMCGQPGAAASAIMSFVRMVILLYTLQCTVIAFHMILLYIPQHTIIISYLLVYSLLKRRIHTSTKPCDTQLGRVQYWCRLVQGEDWHPTPHTLRPTPYTPHTSHSTLCTLHTTPSALHTAYYALHTTHDMCGVPGEAATAITTQGP